MKCRLRHDDLIAEFETGSIEARHGVTLVRLAEYARRGSGKPKGVAMVLGRRHKPNVEASSTRRPHHISKQVLKFLFARILDMYPHLAPLQPSPPNGVAVCMSWIYIDCTGCQGEHVFPDKAASH